MINEQTAVRLEKRAAQAKAAGTPVWIDEAAVLAGAKALREVERLRVVITRIHERVTRQLGEPKGPSDNSALVWIATECEDLLDPLPATDPRKTSPLPTPDPMPALAALTIRKDAKDARIAELEKALREERDRMKSLKTNRLYREYTEVTVDELEEHIALIDAALKEAQ